MDEAERMHQLLTIAAEPPGPPVSAPVPDLVRRARRRLRVSRQATLAAAVLTVAAVTTPLALIHSRRSPAPVAAASALPTGFGAAAPMLGFVSGPVTRQQRFCNTRDVDGSGQLLPSPYGVLALVRLRGDTCSLRVDPASIVLVAVAGQPLAVPVRTEANPNPGGLIRPDLAEAAGDVAVGFAWRGSWCGPQATAVRLAAVANEAPIRTVVTVPLTGRPPQCKGNGDSYIAPGLVGRPEAPVQPPPPAWAALQATVEMPPIAPPDEPVSYRVVLKNTGDRPVTLSPCPDYSLLVTGNVLASSHGSAALSESMGGGKLPCGHVLPPGGSLQVPLVLDGSSGPYRGVVRVEWAMAGVPTARGQVRIG